MKSITLLGLSLILLLAGCTHWVIMSGKYTMSEQNFETVLPEGWRRHNLTKDALLVTRDGLSLQQIRIGRFPVDTVLAYTKKKFSSGVLPQEAAEIIIDNARSNPDTMKFKIIDNQPVSVGGHSGFRVAYSYQTPDGLPQKVVKYGFLLSGWYYYLNYVAPARYYFEKDLQTFEAVKDSFKTL